MFYCQCCLSLQCPCGLVCIGKTTRPLKTCVAEHSSNITSDVAFSPLAVRFAALIIFQYLYFIIFSLTDTWISKEYTNHMEVKKVGQCHAHLPELRPEFTLW